MVELNQELARAAYDTHVPAARALPAEQVLEYRLDADLAINNVNRAMAVVVEFRDQIPVHLPKIAVADLESLPSLALAVKMSALRAEGALPVSAAAKDVIAEGWRLRGMLMPVVAGLAATGVIPQQVYDTIARGRGSRDMAEDCVALSHVFRDYQAAVAGKHSVPAQDMARAEEVGSWLLQNLRAKGAPRSAGIAAEVDMRDRMATLLVQRYRTLQIVAHYFYADAYLEHVSPLMSRSMPKQRDAAEAAASR